MKPEPPRENPLCRCDNCDKHTWYDDLEQPIKTPEHRFVAGCEIPAGECPACGALAYVKTLEPWQRANNEP